MEHIESQNLLLLSLSKYYSIPSNIDKLATIIDNTSSLSLRLIDWYVTNYCKNHNIVYILPGKRYFNVYLNYRAQLKAFKKIQFDPFRRRERITFCMPSTSSYKKKHINTTIGQLNFFRWAIENNVVSNIENNLRELELEMIKNQREVKSVLKGSSYDERSSIRNMTQFKGNTSITFS
jgi:hypothetical protein